MHGSGIGNHSSLIDVSLFDRRHRLTKAEADAIGEIAENVRDWRMLSKMRPHLQRLYRPLECARRLIADNAGQKRLNGYRLINVVLMMGEKRRSFWGWNSSDWRDMLAMEEGSGHQMPMAIAYLLCGIELKARPRDSAEALSQKVFGKDPVQKARDQVYEQLVAWKYTPGSMKGPLNSLHRVLLANKSPRLTDLSFDLLRQMYEEGQRSFRRGLVVLSRILNALGFIEACIVPPSSQGHRSLEKLMEQHSVADISRKHGIHPTWLSWCWRWYETSTLIKKTRIYHYVKLRQAGRWLKEKHPKVSSPAQWDRKLAAAFVAMVDKLQVGDYSGPNYYRKQKVRKPLSAASKQHTLSCMRIFFKDCQEWEWIPRIFNPDVAFRVPTAVKRAIQPNPRVISEPVWAKLLWAGLNLSPDDIPNRASGEDYYPFEFVRAVAVVWLFGGLRNNEVCRLRSGSARWETLHDTNDAQSPNARVCFLRVPLNKLGPSFEKPVDRVVGEVIECWEKLRPSQPALLDGRTGEMVDLLFAFRGCRLGPQYINKRLIPMLCKKAGLPPQDAIGSITSHRARSTIATQLGSAKEGMSLFELQEWLGHRCPSSTKHYLKLQPTKLADAFLKADYFRRNVRMVEVLIDAEAVRSGLPSSGIPWKFYDLGHGFCSYDFFDQCPHRMACAKCDFYLPKESTKSQLLEAGSNLLRMRQEIPLTDEEVAAVEDGIEAMKRLCEKLKDVETPSGSTPAQLVQIQGVDASDKTTYRGTP